MFFNKKTNKKQKCENCGSLNEKKFSFCPSCGNNLTDHRWEKEDFGILGRDDLTENEVDNQMPQNFTLTDKLIGSVFNSLMKNLDKQFKDQFKEMEKQFDNTEIKNLPNGIRIKISGPFQPNQNGTKQKVIKNNTINSSQIKKMSSFPKEKAKTNVKRFGNKIVYELTTPGVASPQDIFISKLESGYEIKAIGDKKVYVNSIPINLPIRKYSILKNKLSVEFLSNN